ncbi:MAG: 50S ribosomal protein L22 [bacterium]
MYARAKARFIHASPRKLRDVVNLIRGRDVTKALNILKLVSRTSTPVEKVLRSAVANAAQLANINEEDLYISKITVDIGPVIKRFRAAPMGRAVKIRKRTSHINIVLQDKIKRKVSVLQNKQSRETKESEKGIQNGTKGSSSRV